MAYGQDIVMGLMPRSNNRFGNQYGGMIDWNSIIPGYEQSTEDMGQYTNQPASYQSFGSMPPPPIPGMPRQQMAFSPQTATPVVSPKTAQAQPQTQEAAPVEQEGEDIGDWKPGSPFNIPDKKWRVLSFQPGASAVVERPGLGQVTYTPGQNAYNAVEQRYSQLRSQYDSQMQQRAQEGQGQPAIPEQYTMAFNTPANETMFGRYDPERKAMMVLTPDGDEVQYNGWSDIPEDKITFRQDPTTGMPMRSQYDELKQTVGNVIAEPVSNLTNYMTGGYKSAPTKSAMYDNLKVQISGGEGNNAPEFKFFWGGEGPAPAGLVENAQKNLDEMMEQVDSYATEYDRVVNSKAPGIIDQAVAGYDSEIADLNAKASAARQKVGTATGKDKTAAQKELDKAERRLKTVSNIRNNIKNNRVLGVEGGVIVEGTPDAYLSSVNPKTWQGKLALASGLGYTVPTQAGAEPRGVLSSQDFAEIAMAQAVNDTEVTPMGIDKGRLTSILSPTVERLKMINDAGKEEYGSNWNNIASQQPATFTYTDVYGNQRTVQKPIGTAINDLNASMKDVWDAVASGDRAKYAEAAERLRRSGELFSGSITPPGGLETILPTKKEVGMNNLGSVISNVSEYNALIPGRLQFGSIARTDQPPRWIYQPDPAVRGRGSDKEKRSTSALPWINFGAKGGVHQTQPLMSLLGTPDYYPQTAAKYSPGTALNSSKETIGSTLLMASGDVGSPENVEALSGIINDVNTEFTKPEAGDLRKGMARTVQKEFADLGFRFTSPDEFSNDLENVYKTGDANSFIRKYWGDKAVGGNPTSTIGKAAVQNHNATGLGVALRGRPDETGLKVTQDAKFKSSQANSALIEAAGNKLQDIAYLYANLGGRGGAGERWSGHTVQDNAGGRPRATIVPFVNPWASDAGQQMSPLTAMSATNMTEAAPLTTSNDQIQALLKGDTANVGTDYDPAGSLAMFNIGGYNADWVYKYLSSSPTGRRIIDRMTQLARTSHASVNGDLRSKVPSRPQDDERTSFDSTTLQSIQSGFFDALTLGSVFPQLRVFARPYNKR
jgi:hypothetical protein